MPRLLARFLKVEQLEDRTVPVVFDGTALDDRFSLNPFGPNSVLVSRYDTQNVLQGQAVVVGEAININGLGGNDQINIDGPLALAFGFDGGEGNDFIFQFNATQCSVQDLGASGVIGLTGGGGVFFADSNVEQVLPFGTAGDDTFEILSEPNFTSIAITGGAGSDTVNFRNLTAGTAGDAGAVMAVASPGKSTAFVTDSDVEALFFFGTAGADQFNVGPAGNYTAIGLAPGAGADIGLVFELPTASVSDFGSFGGVGTPGRASVFFGDGELEQLILFGTGGDDTFTVNAISSTLVGVNGAAGSDTLTIPNLNNSTLEDFGGISIAGIAGSAPVFISDTDIESIYLVGTSAGDTFDILSLPNYASVAVQGGAAVDAIQLLGVASAQITGFSGYGLVAPDTGGGLYFSDEADNLTISGTAEVDAFNLIQRPQNTLLTINGLGSDDTLIMRNLPGAVVTDAGAYGVVAAGGGANVRVSDTDIEFLDLIGNDGNNTFDLSAGVTYSALTVRGGAGNDTILGSPRDDSLFGFGGNDTIFGNGGDDIHFGGANDDTINGGSGNDFLLGNEGNDTLFGGNDNDVLVGEDGNDLLRGENGDDDLSGGSDNDSLFGGRGSNILDGGAGADRILTLSLFGVTDTINSPQTQDAVITFSDSGGTGTPVTYPGYAQTFTFAPKSWTNAEILSVDFALGDLHTATNNTRLLKRSDGAALNFNRFGVQENLTNLVQWSVKNFDDGEIGFADAAFTSDDAIFKSVYYAIAQNWDSAAENGFNFDPFTALSFWVETTANPGANFVASGAPNDNFFYFVDAQFARSFGRDSRSDDYSTTWETFFMENYRGVGSSGNTLVAAKLANILDLIANLSS